MFIDDENENDKKVEWEGLPNAIAFNMEEDVEALLERPLMFLNMAIAE